jgi:5-methylcytosine-specific restriction endonuclease McrA
MLDLHVICQHRGELQERQPSFIPFTLSLQYIYLPCMRQRCSELGSTTWLILKTRSFDWNNVHHIAVKTPRRAAVLKVKAWVSTRSSFRPDGRRAPVFRDLAEAVRPVTQLLSSTRFDYFAHISRRAFKQPGKTGCRSHRRR